jgi:hypothetical protein
MDSDGHIGVHVNWYRVKTAGDAKQPTYQPRVCVKQIDEGAVALFHELFGGHRYLDSTNRKGSARPIHVWQVHSRAAGVALVPLRPFLRIKRQQADLVLELCAINAAPRSRGFALPDVDPDEPVIPLSEAARLVGKSYAVASQAVNDGNVPVIRKGRSVFVPVSYLDTWRTRGRAPLRRREVTERMAEIEAAVKALNSGARNQHFPCRDVRPGH